MSTVRPIFLLKLHKTYYQYGCFNVRLAYDDFVRKDNGPVSLVLQGGPEITGYVYRTANPNGTARVGTRRGMSGRGGLDKEGPT